MTLKPRLSLQFNSTEFVLFENNDLKTINVNDNEFKAESVESTTRLGGQLVLSLEGLERKPKEIELRFVAGVVSKYDEPYEQV